MIIRCQAGRFEVTNEMKGIIDRLGTPFAAGILKKKDHPSLQEIMLERTEMPEIVVNRKAEQLFLYGRDILNKSILSKRPGNGLVLVCNEQGDRLGIGEIEKGIVRNIADIGMYLRKE